MADAPRNRKRAFLLTLGSGQALTLVTMLVAFFATPALVRHLGAERYGVWQVMVAWIGWVGILGGCFTLAVSFQLVPRLAERDPAKLTRFVNATWLLTLVVAAVTIAFALILVPLLPSVAAAPAELDGERRAAFLIAVIAGAVVAPVLILKSVVEADQKGYWLNVLLAMQSLTTTGLAVWLAAKGTGLTGQGIAVAAGMVVHAVALALLVRRVYPWVRLGRTSSADARAIARGTRNMLLLGILGGVAAGVQYPLVNARYGPEVTTQYSLSQRMFLIYAGLITSAGGALWAPLSDLYHRAEMGRFRERLEQSLLATGMLGFGGAVVIAAFTPPFVRLWMRQDGLDIGADGCRAFAVLFPLLGLNSLITWVLSATHCVRAMLICTGTYFAVALGGGWWLGQFGPAGVAWGVAAGLGGSVCLNLWYLRRRFEFATARVAPRLALAAGLALGYGEGLRVLAEAAPPRSWVVLLLAMGAAWAAYLAAAWFVVLTPDARREVAALVRRRRGA